MPSSYRGVDSVIKSHEGLAAVLHAAWHYAGSQEDTSVCAAIDAVAWCQTYACFSKEGHLAVMGFAIL